MTYLESLNMISYVCYITCMPINVILKELWIIFSNFLAAILNFLELGHVNLKYNGIFAILAYDFLCVLHYIYAHKSDIKGVIGNFSKKLAAILYFAQNPPKWNF